MPNLSQQLEALATSFATEVLRAIRSASLTDIMAETAAAQPSPVKRGPGRPKGPPRPVKNRRQQQLKKVKTASVVSLIVDYVRAHPGTSGEAARKALGVPATRWNRAVPQALAEKKIRRVGKKRGTKYWTV
jgi:hypothetical protein